MLHLEIKGEEMFMYSYYVNIMIGILSKCDNFTDVDQLLATYKSRLKEEQENTLSWRYFNKEEHDAELRKNSVQTSKQSVHHEDNDDPDKLPF